MKFFTKPQLSPGRFIWTTRLAYPIGYSYGLDFSRESGNGLGAVYSINAVFEPDVTDDELRRMLQSLLAERFNIRVHKQVKEVDGFALTIAKGGIKMKETAAKDGPDRSDSGGNGSYLYATVGSSGSTSIKAHGATLAQLTRALERSEKRPFWNQTGLQGKYDFAFDFSEVDADP